MRKFRRRRSSHSPASQQEGPFFSSTEPAVQTKPFFDPAEDLQSKRFRGLPKLEAAYDDRGLIFNGLAGDYVAAIQRALMDFGFNLEKYQDDGIFGGETEAAVIAFQRQAGATMIDGIIGPETMRLLDEWALRRERKKEEEEEKDREEDIDDTRDRLRRAIERLRRRGERDDRPEVFLCMLDLYERHLAGEAIASTYLSEIQVNEYIRLDMGNPRGGHHKAPYALRKRDLFDRLDKYIGGDDNRFQEEFYSGSNSMFRAIGLFESLKGNINYYKSRRLSFEALDAYFASRSANPADVYSCHVV